MTACSDAQKASEVVPASISTTSFSDLSCNQLRSEVRLLEPSIPKLEAAVDKDYKRDKTLEAVTWILFWPAVFAMDGNDGEVGDLSTARGKLKAVEEQMRLKGCKNR